MCSQTAAYPRVASAHNVRYGKFARGALRSPLVPLPFPTTSDAGGCPDAFRGYAASYVERLRPGRRED